MQFPTTVPTPVLEARARASAMHGVPLRVLLGVAWVESRFDPTARVALSGTGGAGLMGLTFVRARGLGVDPFSMQGAADGAARYIAKAQERFGGNWERALAAYRWGPQNVRDRPEAPKGPPHVVKYVQEVGLAGPAARIPFAGMKVWTLPLGVGADG